MPQLPETALPELRARWLKLSGAKEVVQHAIAAAQSIEAEYTGTLNMVLRMLELDPALNWRINLETGEIARDEQSDTLSQQNGVPQTVG